MRAKDEAPRGHTRIPDYARGKRGAIHLVHGCYALPDEKVAGRIVPDPLYTVRFAARELWGECANPHDSVHLDLWESYLEPA